MFLSYSKLTTDLLDEVQGQSLHLTIKTNPAQQTKQYAKLTAPQEISVILPGDGLDEILLKIKKSEKRRSTRWGVGL